MKQIEVAVIGTGWCGGIRAETLGALGVGRASCMSARSGRTVWPRCQAHQRRQRHPRLPRHHRQSQHRGGLRLHHAGSTRTFRSRRDCLQAGKHVLTGEADRARVCAKPTTLIHAGPARQPQIHHRLLAALQYARSPTPRRRSPTATLGKPVSVMVSRHLSRSLGKKIASRVRLSPAAMESTHDLDFVVLAAGAGQAGTRLFAGRLRLHAADQRLLRHHVDDGDDGQRRAGGHRWRLEPAPELSQLLRHLDRDHRHRGLAVPRRYTARQLAERRWRTARGFPCRPCPASRSTTCSPDRWGRKRMHFLESMHARTGR